MAESAYLSIGEVLGILLDEFPDVTISKIRFLESQGLIEPERTPSGYRKFYDNDVDLLRAILREQKDNFLPLKVIRDRLESGEIEPDQTGAHTMPRGIRNVDLATVDGAKRSSPPMATLTTPTVTQSAAAGDAGTSQPTSAATLKTAQIATSASATPLSPTPASAASTSAPASRDSVFRRTDVVDDAVPPVQDREPTRSAPSVQFVIPAADQNPVASENVAAAVSVGDTAAESRLSARPLAAVQIADEVDLSQGPLTASELCVLAGISASQLTDLEQYGVVVAKAGAGAATFSVDTVAIARVAGRLLEQGVDARHLRGWRQSADREAALFEQLITPLLRQRNPQARRRAFESLGELADLGGDLRAALMASLVRGYSDSN